MIPHAVGLFLCYFVPNGSSTVDDGQAIRVVALLFKDPRSVSTAEEEN